MRKIVLPLIETDRSLLALQYAKKHFGRDQAEIIIVMSDESIGISATREEEAEALSVVERKLDVIKKVLDGYKVVTKAFVGKAGPCIVKVAREYNADYIVMTKSARSDTLSVVGKTTDYVLNNAYCNVLIVSENRVNSGEYKGLIYKKAQATVNLRGQIGDKQSECLLPSVDADCNYHFDVTVGKIRFFHTEYNPETSNWDMPPSGDQIASIDIPAGETADILVRANSIDGKADRIRIINRGMKQEAVFSYKITAASAPKPLEIPDAPGAMPAPAVISLDSEDKLDDIAPEVAEFEEYIFEEMPVPSLYDTAEFSGLAPEDWTADELSFGLDDDFSEEGLEEKIEINEEDKHAKKEFSFDWSDVKVDENDDVENDEGALDDTLVGLEMYAPNDDEINSIVDELKATITDLDNDIAAREGTPIRFGLADEDIDDEIDIDIEEFFGKTGLMGNGNIGISTSAFDDIFETIPSRDPADYANTSTLSHDFDEIINEFRTSQMGSVEVNIDEDDMLDEH